MLHTYTLRVLAVESVWQLQSNKCLHVSLLSHCCTQCKYTWGLLKEHWLQILLKLSHCW